jgi:hypothetical protein
VALPGAWETFLTAELSIEAPDGAVRVFPAPPLQASGGYPDAEGRAIAVITACNPGGVVVGDAENERAQRALEDDLARMGVPFWHAAGADPDWTHVEPSVAVPGLSETDALELGARYGQAAIFVLTPVSRKVIDCATGRRTMTGWVIVAEADLADEHEEADEAEVVAAVERLEREFGPDPRDWDGVLLAESRWEPEEADVDEDSAEADGAEVGGEFLLRLGNHYVIYETNGVEWDWSELQASDDAAAIEAFSDHTGG